MGSILFIILTCIAVPAIGWGFGGSVNELCDVDNFEYTLQNLAGIVC